MTHEAIERRETISRFTATINSTDLPLGHKLASLVDKLQLGLDVDVALEPNPTPEDPKTGSLLISGTPDQLDIFKRALNIHQESIAGGLSGRALDAEMSNFFALQAIRYAVIA
jgi:hypothetical protein